MRLGAKAIRRSSFLLLALVLPGATCSIEGGGSGEVTQTQPTTTPPTGGTEEETNTPPPPDPNAGTVGDLGAVVTIEPGDATLTRGEIFRFQARVTFPQTSGLTDQGVLWDIKPGPGGERGGVINQDGEYSAPDSAGTYYVVARSVADPAATGVAKVRVKKIGISLTPPSARVNPGSTQQFKATVAGTTNTAVAWSVVEGTLDAGSMRSNGVYTAPFGTGVFHVRASAVEDPTVQATATVYVNTDPYIAVTICPAETTLVPSESVPFSASVMNPLDPGDTAVEWELVPIAGQATGGAQLAGTTVTAGPASGTFEIHARSVTDPSKVARATVTVAPPTTPVLRGWVNHPGTNGPSRIYVGGDGWAAGTTSLTGPGLFKIRGAPASTAPERALFAWVDVEGTQRFLPALNPSGRLEYGTKGNDEFVTMTIATAPLALPTTETELGTPPAVEQVSAMDESIWVQWSRAVTTAGVERATTYDLQIATESDFTPEATIVDQASLSAGLEQTYVKRGLANGTTYYVRVRARAGTIATAWPTTSTHFAIPAASTGGRSIKGHVDIGRVRPTVETADVLVIARSVTGTGSGPKLATTTTNEDDPDVVDFVLAGLSDNQTYEFQVFTDVDGDGRIEPLEPDIPGGRFVAVGTTDVKDVDFAFPGDSVALTRVELDPAGQYTITAAAASGTKRVVGAALTRASVGSFSGPSTPIDLQLASDRPYFFAQLSTGASAPVAGAELVLNTTLESGMTCATVAPLKGVVGQPQSLSVEAELSPTLSWTAPVSSSPLVFYEVTVSKVGENNPVVDRFVPASVTSIDLAVAPTTTLTANTSYVLRITAADADSNSGAATKAFTTPP